MCLESGFGVCNIIFKSLFFFHKKSKIGGWQTSSWVQFMFIILKSVTMKWFLEIFIHYGDVIIILLICKYVSINVTYVEWETRMCKWAVDIWKKFWWLETKLTL